MYNNLRSKSYLNDNLRYILSTFYIVHFDALKTSIYFLNVFIFDLSTSTCTERSWDRDSFVVIIKFEYSTHYCTIKTFARTRKSLALRLMQFKSKLPGISSVR